MKPLPIATAIFTGSVLMSIASAILHTLEMFIFTTLLASGLAAVIVSLILDYILFLEVKRRLDLDVVAGRRTDDEAAAELKRFGQKSGYLK